MSDLRIFDQKGKLRRDFTEAELASLTPERRTLFDDLVAAADDVEKIEDTIKVTQTSLAEHVKLEAQLVRTAKRVSPTDAARDFIRTQQNVNTA